MCSPARLPPRRFPICVSKMSEHAVSIGFGRNQKASTAFAEQNGCRNRAGVVRKKKSISAAAVVRLRCSPETPRIPIRSANFPQIERGDCHIPNLGVTLGPAVGAGLAVAVGVALVVAVGVGVVLGVGVGLPKDSINAYILSSAAK